MVRTNTQNRILTHAIIGLFFVCTLLAPVSSSLTTQFALAQETPLSAFDKAAELVGLYIGNIILSTAAAVTGMGGRLLDYTIQQFVLGMGGYINSSGGLGASIDVMWALIRDICNLAFIFGFIYVGIRTIIDPDNASPKRDLARIIIGALLINFSLFFVKIVIDFSNFTAIQIYGQLITAGSGTISGAIVNQLGLLSLYGKIDPATLAALTKGGTFWYFILAALFCFIAAFVFLAAGILLIVRFVALVLIMVASPLLFAATIFPQTEHLAKDLWRKLISYSFFAPVYLLLTLISIKMLAGVTNQLGSSGVSLVDGIRNTSTTGGDSISVILKFLVAIFFLIQSLLIAKKIGVMGGDSAVSFGNTVRSRGQKFLGSSTFGLGAKAGRATVGRGFHALSEQKWLKDKAANNVMARQLLKGSRVVGDASFDARNVAGVGGKLDIGEGKHGGYKTVLGEVKEKEEKFAKSLGEVGDDDAKVLARKKEMENEERKLRALEVELRAIKDDTPAGVLEKKAKREEIEHQKHEIHDAKVKYETEKQRRVLGSTYANNLKDSSAEEQLKKDISDMKHDLETEWEKYAKLPEIEKEGHREIIKSLMENLEKAKKSHTKFLSENFDRGYAGVLESTNIFKSWPVGRSVWDEQKAGKELRKVRENGLPKEKVSSGGGH